MVTQEKIPQLYDIIQRVNEITANADYKDLVAQVLDMCMHITQAQVGILYVHHAASNTFVIEAVQDTKGAFQLSNGVGCHIHVDSDRAHHILQLDSPLFLAHVPHDSLWRPNIANMPESPLSAMVCVPLLLDHRSIGAIQLWNPSVTVTMQEQDIGTLLHMFSLLVTPHIEKTVQLTNAQRHEQRLENLVDIMSCMMTTLDRERLLNDIMIYAQELLEVEATSIWTKDEQTGDLLLFIATGDQGELLQEVRVPYDHGVIGHVVSTGEPVVVNDVHQDEHFYSAVDQISGFTTRSILCVPLRAPRIQLGDDRADLRETIIGGAQALNKCDGGHFTDEDMVLFEMLASQSATVLQLSRLYKETNKMFWGIIKGISSFIDRKDPYTRGHSLRVAEFSVAIAKEMNLPEEMIHHIHVGGILHDVGKIAVPDEVLKKPDRLTDEEMNLMRQHPSYGINLLEESDLLWLLPWERQAIEEHHERLDGNGYPRGLKGIRDEQDGDCREQKEGISIIGRIVAVADAFDAMASDRPYRPAMTAETAINILRSTEGTSFDADCVDALVRAHEKGKIKVQRERPDYEPEQSKRGE